MPENSAFSQNLVSIQKSFHTVICNALANQPFHWLEHYLLKAYSHDILKSLLWLRQEYGIKRAFICVDQSLFRLQHKHFQQLLEDINEYLGVTYFTLCAISSYYPVGHELFQIYEIDHKLLAEGETAEEAGYLIKNVQLFCDIWQKLQGKALEKHWIWVLGAIKSSRLLEVPLTTKFDDILAFCGGATSKNCEYYANGLLNGSLLSKEGFVTENLQSICILEQGHPLLTHFQKPLQEVLHQAASLCNNCGWCSLSCPLYNQGYRLEPHKILRSVIHKIHKIPQQIVAANICVDCKLCDLAVCPCGLLPGRILQEIQKEFNKREYQPRLKIRPLQSRENVSSKFPDNTAILKRLILSDLEYPKKAECFQNVKIGKR